MDAMDIQAVESKLNDVTVTRIPMSSNKLQMHHHHNNHQQQQQQQQIQLLQHQPNSQHSPTTAATMITTTRISADITTPLTSVSNIPSTIGNNNNNNSTGLTKYAQLLAVIEEMGRDIRPTYSGSRSSAERLKRGIVHARILVRDCLLETERSARQ